jgi:N-acetylneuraminic acid mutarotase
MKKAILILIFIAGYLQAQNVNLMPYSGFPGTSRLSATSFAVSGKGYIAGGHTCGGITLDDVWEYDPVTDAWSQKASLPTVRGDAVGFSINNKGYLSCGASVQTLPLYNDLWEYDPVLNNWIQKSSLPADARWSPIAFVINNIAYIGMGKNSQSLGLNDLWSYDPVTDVWQQKMSLPGSGRAQSFAFSVNNYGYIGGGENEKDFYEYNSTTNTWIQKNDIPNVSAVNLFMGGEGFSIGNAGYVFGGFGLDQAQYQTTIQEYNPITDTWTIIYNSPGPPYYGQGLQIADASVFVINNVPFITQGVDLANQCYSGIFGINITTGVSENIFSDQVLIFPNPSSTEFQISIPIAIGINFQSGDEIILTDALGKIYFTKKISSPTSNFKLQTSNFSNGIYFLELKTKEGVLNKKVVVEH